MIRSQMQLTMCQRVLVVMIRSQMQLTMCQRVLFVMIRPLMKLTMCQRVMFVMIRLQMKLRCSADDLPKRQMQKRHDIRIHKKTLENI